MLAVGVLLLSLIAGCSSASNDKGETAAAPAAGAESLAMDSIKAQSVSSESDQKASANGVADANQSGKTNGAMAKAVETSATAGFSSDAAQTDGLNRKLIYKANLTMKVKDYAKAQSDIRDMVTLGGGYILQFSENSTNQEEGGQFTLKIPSSGFASFMKNLESIPHLNLQRNVQGQDVSEEYVDLEARLKAKQVLEARYLEFMQKATKTDDLVAFTNELGKIQEEIERIKGRMRYIDQNVAFSTVEIRVYQPDAKLAALDEEEENEKGLLERAGDAMGTTFGFLSAFVQGLVVVLAALLPILIVVVIVGIPLWVIYRSGKAKREVREQQQEEERRKRLEYNRMLAGRDDTRQEQGASDTEGQGNGEEG